METTQVAELDLPEIQGLKTDQFFSFTADVDKVESEHPVYPSEKGFYIWYKDSIPDEIDTSILSDEYELLYQSVNYTEYKSRLNLYVSVYSACLTVVLILLVTFPFLPDAMTSLQANQSTVFNEELKEFSEKINNSPAYSTDRESVEGMSRNSIGFTDLKNNVMYVVLPNGKYSVQESSWKDKQKALNRVKDLSLLGIKNQKGKDVKAFFEKADLNSKGTWYRTRVGEFATMKEAIQTAEKIRSLEKDKSISAMFIFPESNLKV